MDFSATWSKSLKTITICTVGFCLGVSFIVFMFVRGRPIMATLPIVVVVSAGFFVVRGYILTAKELVISRLGWTTKVPLQGLSSIERNPQIFKGTIRLMGNGGLFSYSGWFRNKELGRFRAFITNPENTVVLKWPDRIVAVSPDKPEEFIAALKKK